MEGNLDKLTKLWIELEQAQWAVKPGESLIERLSVPPWESRDPIIIKIWEEIINPDNLSLLQIRLQSNLNPTARGVTLKALGDCKIKALKQGKSKM